MQRKLIILSIVVSVLCFGVTIVGASDPLAAGCYVDAPATVDEGSTFTATIRCNSLLSVFGFEIGTALSGDASTAATTFTPGTFTTAASGGVAVGSNTLDVYAVSRIGVNIATGDFSLGSYDVTADVGLTSNGSTTVDLTTLKLSTILGVPILGMLQTNPEAVVTVNNIDLSLLTGNVNVASDGGEGISSMNNVEMTLDGVSYSQASVPANSHAFTLLSGLQFPDLDIDVTADMEGHLNCARTYSLIDGPNVAGVAIGTITLLAGDVVTVSDSDINIQDATAIGAQFGSSSPTGEVDINGDGLVDIYDLVHVGRNYGASAGNCA
ncbi:hypothetical protein G4Y79_16760 [Phototrophicus methaneseepsis]|uniref:Dockerin domain-containing protein n=1 Tax=Phototrophicus methaneseepsis TaxID=2710758 RepID=A0A7S8E6N2_9CHLR|nr:hypothetical protein [Phototrophicus methaneseepsis]QPC81340.1 hypothetical protein G4Y79_16760 [Phototrophicus methaneseepsis]